MNKFTGFPIKKKVFLIDSISNMLVNIFHNQRQMFFLFCWKYVDIVEQLGNSWVTKIYLFVNANMKTKYNTLPISSNQIPRRDNM